MQKKWRIAGAAVFLALMLIVTVIASRWVLSLSDTAKLTEFQDWVASLGFSGWLLLFAIQYVQIVAAFIPGGPIQVVAGALFGAWGGLAICVGGTLLATATVFFIVSKYGHAVIAIFVEEKEIASYKFLKNEKNLERLILLLFFIPGTPKDALTYLFALTSIKMSRFMLLSTLARMPAMLASLFAGDSIVDGNWRRAAIMFVALSIVGACGFFVQNLLRSRINTRRTKRKDTL